MIIYNVSRPARLGTTITSWNALKFSTNLSASRTLPIIASRSPGLRDEINHLDLALLITFVSAILGFASVWDRPRRLQGCHHVRCSDYYVKVFKRSHWFCESCYSFSAVYYELFSYLLFACEHKHAEIYQFRVWRSLLHHGFNLGSFYVSNSSSTVASNFARICFFCSTLSFATVHALCCRFFKEQQLFAF